MKKCIPKMAISKNRVWLFGFLLFYLPYELATVLLLVRLGGVFDIVVMGDIANQRAIIWEIVASFAFLLSVIAISYLLHSLLEGVYLQKVYVFTKEKISRFFLQKSFPDFLASDKAYYQSVLINDLKQLESNFYIPVLNIIKKSIALVVALFFLGSYNLLILLFSLLIMFLPILLPKAFNKKLLSKMNAFSDCAHDYTLATNEMLDGREVFKSYNAENKVLEAHMNINKGYMQEKLRAFAFLDFVQNIAVFSGSFVMISILIFGMILATLGYLSVGDMFAVYFISGGLASPINDLIQDIPKLMASKVFIQKFTYLKKEEEDDVLQTLSEGIEIKDLSISFDQQDTDTLRNINAYFQIGKKYLFVGASGCGKSTTIKALLGYFDDYIGAITYDGISLKNLNPSTLYEKMAYIPQEPYFFHGTIRENLVCFDKSILDQTIAQTLKLVELDEKIAMLGDNSLKKGLDMSLAENASNLSGGEKQRLVLARTLLQNKKIILLDEATSAIDNKTAKCIEKKLLTNPSYTIISTAHRLHEETLRLYDRIMVFDSGEIVETGDFCALILANGKFCEHFNGTHPNSKSNNLLEDQM